VVSIAKKVGSIYLETDANSLYCQEKSLCYSMSMSEIIYPFIPEGRTIEYVPENNIFMKKARDFAKTNSLDKTMPGAAVVVKDSNVIGIGANGSIFHETNECVRVARRSESGKDYELCEGCHPKNHSEFSAIADADAKGHSTEGADLYLWGHWWCCEPCWKSIIQAKIKRVFLMKGSEILFNQKNPNNIIGTQFANDRE